MAAERPMRASDGDRERVVEILREHTAQGRLTFEEFEERIDRAYTARTWDDLRRLTDDLPVRTVFSGDGGGADGPERAGRVAQRAGPARVAPPARTMLLPALLGGALLALTLTGTWSLLPLLLIGIFVFAGPCGGRDGATSCTPRSFRAEPPRGR